MDLSIHHLSNEASEYRHKKFDHIRSSPITVQQQTPVSSNQFEYQRSLDGTPYSYTTNSTCNNSGRRNLELPTYIDDIQIPGTPTSRRQTLTSSSKSKRKAENSLCNAPKKRKFGYDPRPTTPISNVQDDNVDISSLMPKISKEAIDRICQYNKNMVRKFPKKERTSKDQERRDKNTVACRMSRRLKKLENLAIEEQYKIFAKQHLEQYKQSMHAAVYLNKLMDLGCKVKLQSGKEKSIETIAKQLNLKNLEKISLQVDKKQVEVEQPEIKQESRHKLIKQEKNQLKEQFQEQRLNFCQPQNCSKKNQIQELYSKDYQYRTNWTNEYQIKDSINQKNQLKTSRTRNTQAKGLQTYGRQQKEYKRQINRENHSHIGQPHQDQLKTMKKRSFTIAYILGPQ